MSSDTVLASGIALLVGLAIGVLTTGISIQADIADKRVDPKQLATVINNQGELLLALAKRIQLIEQKTDSQLPASDEKEVKKK